MFTDDEAWDVLADIPNDSAAALILLEHHWAVPLRDAIARAGGFRISDGFISPLDLVEIGLMTAEEAQELHELETAGRPRPTTRPGQRKKGGRDVRITQGSPPDRAANRAPRFAPPVTATAVDDDPAPTEVILVRFSRPFGPGRSAAARRHELMTPTSRCTSHGTNVPVLMALSPGGPGT